MGPLGMPEIIVLFVILVVIATVLGAVLLLKSRKGPPASCCRSNSAEDRISELDALRRKNLITETEYETKRKDIVDSL